MARLFNIKVKNFRALESFEHCFNDANLICLIGRGDAGKTTILDAISFVLSPNWRLSLDDTDFYNCNVTNPIIIEAVVYDIPEQFISESKYFDMLIPLDLGNFKLLENIDDDTSNLTHALKIRLVVESNLEPVWSVIGLNGQEKRFSPSDREKLNMFNVSDYIDRHFSWGRGTPLYRLIDKEISVQGANTILDATRNLKKDIDNQGFSQLDDIIQNSSDLLRNLEILGVSTDDINTTIDYKDLSINEGRVSLHIDKLPLRLKGKGSKRLASIAIQLGALSNNGIVLIDEIEQGLEPDRVQALVRTLKDKSISSSAQIFFTTHSRDAIVELEAIDLHRLDPSLNKIIKLNEELQGTIRDYPDAFFAKKVIVCEGATEVGIVRAIDNWMRDNRKSTMTLLGARYLDAKGASKIVGTALNFQKAGYDVCIFCDSDVNDINEELTKLKELGQILVVDCEVGNCIEKQVFEDINESTIADVIELAIELNSENTIIEQMRGRNLDITNWANVEDFRNKLGLASTPKGGGWFKGVGKGEALGNLIMGDFDELNSQSYFYNQIIKRIIEWANE